MRWRVKTANKDFFKNPYKTGKSGLKKKDIAENHGGRHWDEGYCFYFY